MAGKRWIAAEVSYEDRMPALAPECLDQAQRKAAQELASGPRGGVKGPFVALLRSPALLDRLGKVDEQLRFGSSLPARVSELVMLVVAREWTNRFEWAVHAPIARRSGVGGDVIDALAQGRYPRGMASDEEIAYEVCDELSRTKGVCDETYRRAAKVFGENGLVDLVAVYGYFVTVCAIMNVAHTPPPDGSDAAFILPFPL